MSTFTHFLLAFDSAHNKQLAAEDLGSDPHTATTAYFAMEEKYRGQSSVNVLLVGSDSLETVKATHSTYFVDGSINLVREALQIGGRYR